MRKEFVNAKFEQNNEIDASDLNGDKVMMNLDKGMYFALNNVGSRIWDIIEKPRDLEEIVNILMAEYDVDKDECKNSVLSFLEGLERDELIKVS